MLARGGGLKNTHTTTAAAATAAAQLSPHLRNFFCPLSKTNEPLVLSQHTKPRMGTGKEGRKEPFFESGKNDNVNNGRSSKDKGF